MQAGPGREPEPERLVEIKVDHNMETSESYKKWFLDGNSATEGEVCKEEQPD